jgi:serine/threonine-protein phosphatase 2A regulatory subunit A
MQNFRWIFVLIKGPSRTREELIPYLIEIIEECDNEEEFLIKMAD